MGTYKSISYSDDTIEIVIDDKTITLEDVSEKTVEELNGEANTQYGSTLEDLHFHKKDDDSFVIGTGDCTGNWWKNED